MARRSGSVRNRMWLCAAVVLVAVPPSAAAQAGDVYTVDNAHSLMDFTIRLLGFNRVRGTFTHWRADVYYDASAIERSSVTFIADAASISTGVDERDADLRAASWFDVARFPRLRFVSTHVEATAAGFVVTGDLTIRDSTHRVRLPVQVLAPLGTDPFGNRRVSFGTNVTLSRSAYGVVGPPFWNRAVSDSMVVEIEIGARVWDYSRLGWPRRSVGELLFTAADSGRLASALSEARGLWNAHRADTSYSFSAWEFEKAGMRLAQSGRLADALRILDLAVELHHDSPPGALAELLARRGEVRLRAGRRSEGVSDMRRAVSLDPDNTNAAEWLRHAEALPPQ